MLLARRASVAHAATTIAGAAAFVLIAFATVAAPCGCAAYRGTAVAAEPTLPSREVGWIWVRGLPEVRQQADQDCGPAALSAVLAYWGLRVSPSEVRAAVRVPQGSALTAGDLKSYARARGFDAYVVRGAMSDVVTELQQGRPVIVGAAKLYGAQRLAHFEVVVGVEPVTRRVLTLDPAEGWRTNTWPGFLDEWEPTGNTLIVLLAPGPSRS
jgi:ABC-type bacteriocin/lantibiotic exporter with double-glycine peptidase domain